MSKRISIRVAVYGLLFFICAMTAMTGYCVYGKDIENQSGAKTNEQSMDNPGKLVGAMSAIYKTGNENAEFLYIPLDATEKNVSCQVDPMEQVVYIKIKSASEEYFEQNPVTGNIETIADMAFYVKDGEGCLKITTNGVYEIKQTVKDGQIRLQFVAPDKIYDRLVVIDPGHGGSDAGGVLGNITEENIALDIALRLEAKLENKGIGVYLTRDADIEQSIEKRVRLANDAGADLFLSLHTAADEENQEVCGIETDYNDTFIIPSFGSGDFAYLVETEVVNITGADALGMEPALAEDALLQKARMPVARLNVGYLTNGKEAQLLGEAEYRQKIADGLYQAILKSYEDKEGNHK